MHPPYRYARLIGADFRQADLSKADLTLANLTGANLTEQQTLTDANLSGAIVRTPPRHRPEPNE